MFGNKNKLQDYPNLHTDMSVYTKDGERLGKIEALNEEVFTVEKGIFFPRSFTILYEDIGEIREGSVYLSSNRGDFEEWRDESFHGWTAVDEMTLARLRAHSEYKNRRDRKAG